MVPPLTSQLQSVQRKHSLTVKIMVWEKKYVVSRLAYNITQLDNNLAIRASPFSSQGPIGPHVPAEGFVTIFPQLSAGARENGVFCEKTVNH